MTKGFEDHKWTFNNIIGFLRYQKERVEETEITGGTLSNFVKTIKLFCEMTEIPIHWKKITRGLPKSRKYAYDRGPTIDIIRQNIICNSGKIWDHQENALFLKYCPLKR